MTYVLGVAGILLLVVMRQWSLLVITLVGVLPPWVFIAGVMNGWWYQGEARLEATIIAMRLLIFCGLVYLTAITAWIAHRFGGPHISDDA